MDGHLNYQLYLNLGINELIPAVAPLFPNATDSLTPVENIQFPQDGAPLLRQMSAIIWMHFFQQDGFTEDVLLNSALVLPTFLWVQLKRKVQKHRSANLEEL